MRFTYCPHCGNKAIKKEIGDEGLIPYCTYCEIPLWDIFTTCIISAVINENNEIALLRQNYISATKYVCVSGIMKLGESAEETAIREIEEEIGLKVKSLEYIKSYPYEKKEMLMLGYKAVVEKVHQMTEPLIKLPSMEIKELLAEKEKIEEEIKSKDAEIRHLQK